GDVVEYLELESRIIAQEHANLDELRGFDRDERVERLGVLARDRGAELLFEKGDDLGVCHVDSWRFLASRERERPESVYAGRSSSGPFSALGNTSQDA